MLITEFRTEVDYPRIVAYAAWFDHTRTAVAYYPGRYEPPRAPVRGPMEVPQGQRWRLLATFNSGFIYTDGLNGSSIGGSMLEPLKQGLATMIAYRDGRVDVKTWTGGPVAGKSIAFARQSLPLIVDHGRLNPALNDSTQWGFTLGNAVRVWRTGAGIDRRGNLIYETADYKTIESMARILQRAGAVRAMQLDITPGPTLITTRMGRDGRPKSCERAATGHALPGPDDRDFYAVYRRLPGPVRSVQVMARASVAVVALALAGAAPPSVHMRLVRLVDHTRVARFQTGASGSCAHFGHPLPGARPTAVSPRRLAHGFALTPTPYALLDTWAHASAWSLHPPFQSSGRAPSWVPRSDLPNRRRHPLRHLAARAAKPRARADRPIADRGCRTV